MLASRPHDEGGLDRLLCRCRFCLLVVKMLQQLLMSEVIPVVEMTEVVVV